MRKTIYINDELVLNKLSQEKNQSRYISDLIMKDIIGDDYITEERVLQIIKQYFSFNNLQINNVEQNTPEEIKDSILSVLNCDS